MGTRITTLGMSLYILNDELYYDMAKDYDSYEVFAEVLSECFSPITPDGVSYTDPDLDYDKLNELLTELV